MISASTYVVCKWLLTNGAYVNAPPEQPLRVPVLDWLSWYRRTNFSSLDSVEKKKRSWEEEADEEEADEEEADLRRLQVSSEMITMITMIGLFKVTQLLFHVLCNFSSMFSSRSRLEPTKLWLLLCPLLLRLQLLFPLINQHFLALALAIVHHCLLQDKLLLPPAKLRLLLRLLLLQHQRRLLLQDLRRP